VLPSEAARCIDLVKTYRTPTGAVHALRGVTLMFPSAALTAVVGPSGSGKSSLLRVLTGIDRATFGEVWVGGRSVARSSARKLRRLRRDVVGYVFQRPSDNFLPNLTVGEHLRLASGRADAGLDVLEALGISHRIDHLPSELSGGEQQRAAFAQAVVAGSKMIVADEPTAELDTESAKLVMGGVRTLVNGGVTFVIATHDSTVRRSADEVIELDHGRVKGTDHVPASRTDAKWLGGARLPSDDPAAVSVREVSKVFHHHEGDVIEALRGVSVEARPGELVGLVGRSGSGKTTLLNVIAGWERPTGGVVAWADGVDPSAPDWSSVAVVPQKLGLMEELTVEENVRYPARLAGLEEERADQIEETFGVLGLDDLRARYPREASVGEQQRTAIARALAVPTRVLLADEPTGHQDTASADRVFAALRRAADGGTAVVIATHNRDVIRYLDRVFTMADGRLEEGARS
jgi:putative ABC transport system ATP-binding protein